MKNVTIELDPKKDGSFIARSNETGEIVAVGGRIESYDPDAQEDGKPGGSFVFSGFREVVTEEDLPPPRKNLPFEVSDADRQQVVALLRRVNSPKTRSKAVQYLLQRYRNQIPINPVEKCQRAVELIIEQEKLS
jgi:hypothetical protein